MKRLTSLVAASLVLALGVTAQAQIPYYFDVNDDAAGSGVTDGSLYAWNTTTPGGWNTNNADGTQTASGLNVAFANGNDAVFSAGTDGIGQRFGLSIAAGTTANSATIEEGTVLVNSGLLNTGTGTVTVNAGATLEVNNTHSATYGLNGAGKVVLNGGQLLNTHPSSASAFIPGAKILEINGSGIVNYTSAAAVSIYTAGAAAGIMGTGGTPTNGGAGTLIKRGNAELRYQGAGLPNTSYAKLRVEQGLFRLGFSTVDVEERGFGAVPLAPLADAITLDGGFIAHSFNPTTLNVNRGITVTANGGGWSGGTLTVPGSFTGNSTTMQLTGGVFLLTNANNATTFTNSKFVATAGTIGGNSDTAFGAVPASPVADYFTLGNATTGLGTVRVDTTMTLNSNRGMTLVTGTTGGGQLTTGSAAVTATYNGKITGGGNLTKTGLGTWVLGGNNDYTGITTSFGGGILSISSESNIGTTPASPTPTSISLAGGTTGGTLQATSSISLSPNRGVFLSPGQPTATAGDPTTAVGGTLDVTSGSTLTVPGVISGTPLVGTTGAGRLTKSGTGTLVVTNDNTYTGSTTISGGSMLVNNTTGSGTGSGAVSVGASGVLGGTGIIAGAVTNSGVIAPGSSGIGTLRSGSVTDNGGAIWHIELSGATSDKLAVTGNIDLSAADTLSVTGIGSGSSWVIGSYSGTLAGAFDSVPLGYSVNYGTGTNSVITLNAASCAPGDFNCDTHVDAGDYASIRKNFSDITTGAGLTAYSTWRTNFGNPPGAGSAGGLGNAPVPEPTSIALVIIGLGFVVAGRRRTR